MEKINIKGVIPYNVYIENNSIEKINETLQLDKNIKLHVFADVNVDESTYRNAFVNSKINKLAIDEKNKNFNSYLNIIETFKELKIKRNDLIIVIGGGVTLDILGFACSTYLRGVEVIYIPTTLMAMVDAAIGSKNAIHFEEKNILGTFYDPKAVFIDPQFLKTLPKREIQSGIAEIIKIALLYYPKVLHLIDGIFDENYDWLPIITTSVALKGEVVNKDYYDKSIRKYLNFGHTFGHAIEAYYNFEKFNHGEAVSIGLCLAYPNRALFKLLNSCGLPIKLPSDIDFEKLFELMKKDKKNMDDSITFISLKTTGEPCFEKLDDKIELFKKLEIVNAISNEIL